MSRYDRGLTESAKELAEEKGAALVGVASVDRFDPVAPFNDEPPAGHHPRDFVPDAESVISFAMPILDPVMDAPAALADKDLEMIPPDVKYEYLDDFYNEVGHVVHDYMLEFIGQVVGQFLSKEGYKTMFFPTTGLHPTPHEKEMTDREIWEDSDQYAPFNYTFGPFSHRHAATRAGLGEFGFNNLVLTEEFGPRQRFNSIVTEAPLEPDPLISEPICLREECNFLCQEACFMDAITMRDDQEVTDYRTVQEVNIDDIFIDTPAKTDPKLCRRRRDRDPYSPVRGDCNRVCPLPEDREQKPKRLEKLMDRILGN